VLRSANQEAIGQLTARPAQLVLLPNTPARAKQKPARQRLLGQTSFAVKGNAFPERRRLLGRAHELCASIDDDENVCPALIASGTQPNAMPKALDAIAGLVTQLPPKSPTRTGQEASARLLFICLVFLAAWLTPTGTTNGQ
jgi:hypothetical protein